MPDSPWHDPITWQDGDTLLARTLNEQIRDNLNHLYYSTYPIAEAEGVGVPNITLNIPEGAPPDLRLIITGRNSRTDITSRGIGLVVNANISPLWDRQILTVNGASVTAVRNVNLTTLLPGNVVTDHASNANKMSTYIMDFFDHNNPNAYKNVHVKSVLWIADVQMRMETYIWNSFDPITTIRVGTGADNNVFLNAYLYALRR